MDQQKERELVQVNVDLSCQFKCERCEKFYECDSEKKWDVYKRRRMGKALQAMSRIKYKIAVAGGKGGVGKSTLAVNLACAFAMMGRKVSVLDQDFDGATIPKMFGVVGKKLQVGPGGLIPVEGLLGIQILSMGSIIKEGEIVTMFHELRRSTTEEFLAHVDYGERDFLIVDLPPGTSSDAANLMQYIPDLDGTLIVTISPYVSQLAARRASLMSIKTGVPVLGIIENMSGCICDKCGEHFDVFTPGGGKRLADELEVPFLGTLPLNSEVSAASDAGVPFVHKHPDNIVSKKVMELADQLENYISQLQEEKS